MPKATFRYAVTLEFTEDAPVTVRGTFAVANARLGARRAVEAAFRKHPGRRWTSLSLLLERSTEAEARETQETVAGLTGVER